MTGMSDMSFVVACMTAYLLGSIPTGLLLGKACGVDVRKEGSGNIGATNLYRTVGRKVGVLTLIGDCLKGLVPVLVTRYLGFSVELVAVVGLAAFCGHVFSVFLGFKGGKGVATALGVFLGLVPWAVLLTLGVFAAVMVVWRYVSLGSICAAAAMMAFVAFTSKSAALISVTCAICFIIILKHHQNIVRLLDGTESKFKA